MRFKDQRQHSRKERSAQRAQERQDRRAAIRESLEIEHFDHQRSSEIQQPEIESGQ